MIKTTCGRCGGSGSHSYNQIDGTMCYGCRGKGFVMISEATLKARERRQEILAAKRQASIEQGQAMISALFVRYANDPRMAQLVNIPSSYHHMHLMAWAERDAR